MSVEGDVFNCCICKEESKGWGNNPEPVVDTMDKDGKIIIDSSHNNVLCCDECFDKFVNPARFRTIGIETGLSLA